MPLRIQHLRVARPTTRLAEVVRFYRDVLEFEVLGEFIDHEGFDGVMLGRTGLDFHLEFTHERGSSGVLPLSPEQLIVFYVEEHHWPLIVARLRERAIAFVSSHNPYWDRHAVTIEDPDGSRVVIHRGPWTD